MIPRSFSPTPVQELSWPERPELRIFMKREDLLPFSFGGNKVRIAAAYLADMRSRNKNAMILYGDRRSNLCRVLAAACHEEDIPYIMIATAEHSDGSITCNERLIGPFAPEILPCEKNAVAEAVDEAFLRLRDRGYDPYYIYGNRLGQGNEGTAGAAYGALWPELEAWQRENRMVFDAVYVPTGTGGTVAGLAAGAALAGSAVPVIGISVSSRSPERAQAVVNAGFRDTLARMAPDREPSRFSPPEVLTRYNGGGYGLYHAGIETVIRTMLRENTVPLDPTYTGKAFLGMLEHTRDFPERRKLLFLHTGGTPLFYDYLLHTNI